MIRRRCLGIYDMYTLSRGRGACSCLNARLVRLFRLISLQPHTATRIRYAPLTTTCGPTWGLRAYVYGEGGRAGASWPRTGDG